MTKAATDARVLYNESGDAYVQTCRGVPGIRQILGKRKARKLYYKGIITNLYKLICFFPEPQHCAVA
jgi:hypothetical protein